MPSSASRLRDLAGVETLGERKEAIAMKFATKCLPGGSLNVLEGKALEME